MCDGKKKPRSGAVCVAPPLLSSHSRYIILVSPMTRFGRQIRSTVSKSNTLQSLNYRGGFAPSTSRCRDFYFGVVFCSVCIMEYLYFVWIPFAVVSAKVVYCNSVNKECPLCKQQMLILQPTSSFANCAYNSYHSFDAILPLLNIFNNSHGWMHFMILVTYKILQKV